MSYNHCAYWPIALFWKTFGVLPANAWDGGRRNTSNAWPFTAVLTMSCGYALFAVPSVVCRIGEKCTSESIKTLKEIYPVVANVTSALSRIALTYSVTVGYDEYRETMECYETYAPTTVAEAGRRRAFGAAAVCGCLLLVVPVNVLRLRLLWLAPDIPGGGGGGGIGTVAVQSIVLYAFVYIQNLTMCCSETQFAEQCFALYSKLKAVNDDVAELGGPAGLSRFSGGLREVPADAGDAAAPADRAAADDAADAVEALRIRHWLLREAAGCLNRLFGVQLGMSVCALCVMSFFDIYYETFHLMGEYVMSDLVIYSWILHYAVRYVGIILMSHYTTKQALYTKTLIANLKSNYLDCSINKELCLFLDQVSHSSVEFTACDIFTLNIRLIISTFAAGLTYLVILIQYQTNNKKT